MDNISNYNFIKEEYEKELRLMSEFFKLLNEFSKLDYSGRVDKIKELCGEIKESTLYFGSYCKLVIFLDDKKKYRFKFDCQNGNVDALRESFPELSEMIQTASVDEIKEKFPNVTEISVQMPEEKEENKLNDMNAQFISSYNNIKINKKDDQK